MKIPYTTPEMGFYIGGFEIRFYGLIMSIAMLLGVCLACLLARKHKIKSDDIILLAIIILPCAVIGARLYYCCFYEYNYSFKELFMIKNGGLAIFGGVIGGFIGMIIFCIIKKDMKLLVKICDIVVPCLILGQALGRWGNFFNQEAYGNMITDTSKQWFPYAVWIDDKKAWFQATFFYESVWNIIGFVFLLIIFAKSKRLGSTTGFYLVWYGIGRVLIEGLRADSLYIGTTGIRVSQLLSAILIVVGLVILVYNIYKLKKSGKKGVNNG